MKPSNQPLQIYIFAAIAVLSLYAQAKFDNGSPPRERPPIFEAKTEAQGVCVECGNGGNADMDRLKLRIAELEKALSSQPKKPSEEDVKLAEHSKDRALKKIRKMECPKPDSMFGDDEDERPGFGDGPGMGSGPGMTAIMREEIEDAMEDKMAKCKKQALRQQMQGGQSNAGMFGGTSIMGNSGMGGMNMFGMGMNSNRNMNQFPMQAMNNTNMTNPWMSMMSVGNMYGSNSQYSQFLPSYLQMNMNPYGTLGLQ